MQPGDLAAMTLQLGRPLRAVRDVGHRCPCGLPDVAETAPRLEDGSPFPTVFYLTCPRLIAEVSRLEAAGVMTQMQERLGDSPTLAAAYRHAHEDYLARREARSVVTEIAGVSAGGMPNRVKCLHALAAHSLTVGEGVNPLGDETLALVAPWWVDGPCVHVSEHGGGVAGRAAAGAGEEGT